MYKKDHEELKNEKKEIGRRFKAFRTALGKSQGVLATELKVYQSTVTNIEVGKTFPCISYLKYFQNQYHLNLNWMINEMEGMIIPNKPITPFKSLLYSLFMAAGE